MLKFLESLAKDGQKICTPVREGSKKQLDLSRFIRRPERLAGSGNPAAAAQRPAGPVHAWPEARDRRIIDETSVLQLLVRQQAPDLEGALERDPTSFTVDPGVLQPLQAYRTCSWRS
jgi:hypothetical protein